MIHALVLSDDAIQDQASKRWSIFHTFGGVQADGFPAVVSKIAVYVRATFPEARHYRINVDLSHVESKKVIATLWGELTMNAPGKPWEVGMPMANFSLPTAGTYQATLFVDDQPMAFAQFDASVKPSVPNATAAETAGGV